MSRWYRRYVGTVSDPKLAEVAMDVGCSRAVAIAVWDAILESAAESNADGSFKATSRNVAATLMEQPETVERVFAAMTALGMIENGVVIAWSKRQFQSDNSTERSRRHRQAKKNPNENNGTQHMQQDATLQGRCATPPDTDTESETDTEKYKNIVCHSIAARDDGQTDPNFEKCKRELNGSTERLIAVVVEADGVYGSKAKAAEWIADTLDDFGTPAVLDAFRFMEDCRAKGQPISSPKRFISKNAARSRENVEKSVAAKSEASREAQKRALMRRF